MPCALCGPHPGAQYIPHRGCNTCAQIEGDEAFLQRVGRAGLLPKVAAARAEAAKEGKNGKRGTRKASRA
jgi:hypothetical protein